MSDKFTILKHSIYIGILLFCLFSCSSENKPTENSAFTSEVKKTTDYDWNKIQESGELIIGTISGPDTYFDYQGVPMGLQYALAENFAQKEGLKVRVEVAHDTTELKRLLSENEIDLIAYRLPEQYIQDNHWQMAGVRDDSLRLAWCVRREATELARILNEWYGKGVALEVTKEENSKMTASRQVRRRVRAPFISREKGLISPYDHHFKAAAAATGWDWRLIAAQCYQESGFDPNAVSWAGARGLMQIMPATGQFLGLTDFYDPTANVQAASKYIRHLQGLFRDVRDRSEQIKFVLAAYNGGTAHIRDAMALTRKYGKNPYRWEDVSFYVRALSLPAYYRDPIVKSGYMIGNETANYVTSILDRWRAYGGSGFTSSFSSGTPMRSEKKNKFTRGTKIYRPDDPEFTQMKE